MRARVRVNKTKLSRPGNREEEEEEQTANTLEAPSIRLRGTLPSSFRSAILQGQKSLTLIILRYLTVVVSTQRPRGLKESLLLFVVNRL